MSELIDLVDRNGKLIVTGVERNDALEYPQGFMQIAVVVVFNDQGDILAHQRASTKSVDPDCIDHICGGIQSGQTPEQAAQQEGDQETGVTYNRLVRAHQGVNAYNRYRYIFGAISNDTPQTKEPDQVQWVKWAKPHELEEWRDQQTYPFVEEYFLEIELAKRALNLA
ncbi:MAG TPA: NUDIX hydrolase [Verrucomicrobiae bacterium]|nr:NUDIX hydrolase [Verrucomicrobiae bacterium]